MDKLSNELLINILRHLDVRTLTCCAQVNHQLYNIFNDNYLWKILCYRDIDEQILNDLVNKYTDQILDDDVYIQMYKDYVYITRKLKKVNLGTKNGRVFKPEKSNLLGHTLYKKEGTCRFIKYGKIIRDCQHSSHGAPTRSIEYLTSKKMVEAGKKSVYIGGYSNRNNNFYYD